MIGKVIDNAYRVDTRLGAGAFGVVYLATEMNLNRSVAIKMIRSEDTEDREVKRFLSEARNLARLNHPNVVQIYRLGEWEGAHYIAMEYLTGRTLRQVQVQSERRMPLDLLLGTMKDVARGLNAIHEIGVVHRDLSANNIMVTDAGVSKILDLGLAKGLQMGSRGSREQYLAGTILYVAPELIAGEKASPQSDIFSFGVVFYEMLTGASPFQAEHHMSVLYNIAHREPKAITSYWTECPDSLNRLVCRCLEKQPERRPQSALEIEAGLDNLDLTGNSGTLSITRPVIPRKEVQSTPSNPYLNRVMIKRPEHFYGRKKEVKRIYSRLNATPPGSVAIVGDRKSGKSSLLNYVYMRRNRQLFLEAPDRVVMAFLDLKQEKDMSLKSFVEVLVRMVGYELRDRLDVGDCSLDLDGIRMMVQRLDDNEFRLALLLDEFEAITNNKNFDLEFFSFLRFLANHYNVAYITSSTRDLQVLCHTKEIADSPFFNIFTTMKLSSLDRSEAEELITKSSAQVGKPLEAYSGKIIEMAGLFPFFLQMACSHAIEYLDENEGEPEFDEIGKRFYEEARLHYRFMWDGFDSHERSAILRVANGKQIPDALRHVLAELERRHYVEDGSSGPRLFSSSFDMFAKTEAQEGVKRSWFNRMLGR
jgi:serine/threonine-protein kinase